MTTYSEKQYDLGIRIIATQIIEMVIEDGGDVDDEEEFLAVAMSDIEDKISEIKNE